LALFYGAGRRHRQLHVVDAAMALLCVCC